MKLLRILIISLFSGLLFSGTYPRENAVINDELRAHFGFSINPTANTGLITYAVVETDENNKILSRKIVSRNNRILMMRGLQYSKANPEKKDLWSEKEIGDCFWLLDNSKDKYEALNCIAQLNVDDLWRLRYNKNPQYRQDKVTSDSKIIGGWAANAFRPNWPQIQILQKYGIVYISDFFFGDNMFQLMKDVQEDTWVDAYIAAE
ncbi:MAG: hypothetical protein JKY54_08075 [Flavobacteriales bacterium]|nr:hypothetical protein [Flavobacteriales bacterium]